jgi:hypothetical protein
MVDLVHQARRFGSPEAPWDEAALLGDDGWPVGDFGLFLATRQAETSHFPGTYRVRFHGKATVTAVASRASIGAAIFDAIENVTTVEVTVPDGGNQLALAFTGTGPGIKDLRVIRPGYDPVEPPLFTREFLEHIAPFKTLRLMDWLRTNNNPVRHWAERSTPAATHYNSPQGMPWEYVTALARETGQDLWINIPAQADDDYVRQLAGLLLRENCPRRRGSTSSTATRSGTRSLHSTRRTGRWPSRRCRATPRHRWYMTAATTLRCGRCDGSRSAVCRSATCSARSSATPP